MAVPPSSPSPSDPAEPAGDEQAPTEEGTSRAGVMMVCAAVAVLLALNLFGGGNDASTGAGSPPHAPPAAGSVPAASAPAGPTPPAGAADGDATGKHLPRSRPVRLFIPKIGVDAPFVDLAIGATGQLEPPPADDVNLVGWHADGASPGETGTSIIAGHVDTKTSPAVFAGLSALAKGDGFQVLRADGSKASFRVDSVETFDKADFPSERVYSDTSDAQVRLITCAGAYDRRAKDYTDNLVVFAHLV
ncbi:LPXTG-site transpeptidase (sortase) family protein [Streptomyces sp. 3330]|uniref:class F sortase n=1 Tax=Streptomyces sp. 3330 TaxID=2817755 RepID=UPI002860DA9C|nr:class F sortase [Streptomyces sp. 3330]MDR6975003.1 LPXTG-site transpeptidase (sortase) family protein [Streptomyces sp. 3330]